MTIQSMPNRSILLAAAAALALSACEQPVATIEEGAAEIAEEAPAETPEPLFRAVGQEPGWILRIYEDEIVYEADYGERTVRALTPEAEETETGRRYVTNRFAIEIVDEECEDVMSGARYAAQVTITEGERTRLGCGGDEMQRPGPGLD